MRGMNRRKFVKIMGAAGAAAIVPWRFDFKHGWQAGAAYAAVNSPGLAMWAQGLRGLADIPIAASDGVRNWSGPVVATHYTIGIRQFTDQLHPAFGANSTTLWGYGQGPAANYRHLGGLIIANKGTPVQITFQNFLTDTGALGGANLNHILPVDASILGANQAHNRTAVHIHGGCSISPRRRKIIPSSCTSSVKRG